MCDIPTQTSNTRWIWCHGNKPVENPEKVGKWMLFYSEVDIDKKWKKACELVDKEMLFVIKSSTNMPTSYSKGDFVLIIYTADYDDKEDVFKVAKIIKENIGYNKKMYYKTDNQTRANIYARNGKGKAYIHSF